MLVYTKFISILSTVFNNKSNTNNDNSLELILKFYKWLAKNYSISFLHFSEIYYVFNKFNNINKNIFFDIFVFSFLSNRLTSVLNYSSLLKNNSLIYFFNSPVIQKITLVLYKNKNIINSLSQSFSSNFFIRYSPTNVAKYLHTNYLNITEILYLRKNKVFNKGRYSRNRQFYRTGVYWCLYINIIAIVGLYFWFYRFVMNFGYLWWLLYLSLASFVLAKSLNFNLHNPKILISSIISDLYFFINIVLSSLSFVSNFVSFILNKLSNVRFINKKWIINSINLNFLFIKTLFSYIYQHDTSFNLFKCNTINYYIYSITLNYNRVFLNTNKYKFSSLFLKTWTQIEL